MEGERILQDLKTEKYLESLLERATNYVAPLFHTEPPPCSRTLSKLELFSLKLFKQSLESTKASSPGPAAVHLRNLCQLAIACLQMCAGASEKVPALSFEKLLLHFAQLCLSQGDFSNGIDTCQQLRRRLGGKEEGERGGREGVVGADTLLKHAFDLVWKAAIAAEQKAQSKVKEKDVKSEDYSCSVAELCLNLREEAFLCLLTTREKNAVFSVERILRSSQRYQQLVMGRARGSSTASAQRLSKFHTTLLAVCDLPSLLPTTESFLHVDYLCVLAKVAHKASQRQQATGYLTRAREACGGLRDSMLKDGSQKMRGRRRKNGSKSTPQEGREGDSREGINAAHLALINMTSALFHLDQPCVEEDLSTCLHSVAAEMERVVGHSDSLCCSQLHRLFEGSEELFAALERRRVEVKREAEGWQREGSATVVPRESLPSLISLAASHVQLVEVRLATSEKGRDVAEEQVARSAQLSVLNLVTQVLLLLLLFQEEYPDIETPRSSMASPPHTPSHHLTHKQTLAEFCLPLLASSQAVIVRASQDVLSDSEHRWLGNSGYNVGLALFRTNRVHEACNVLRLANDELKVWCEAGESEAVRMARWREAQLLKKTSLLVDCLRDSGCHGDVMETLVSTARVLPARLMCESGDSGSGDGVEVMVEMWVRGKKELASCQPDSASLQQWRERTLLSLLPPAHPPLSTKHRAHILSAEFAKCASYVGQGSTNHIAAGYELIEVCREGGREWDVERGRVMVAMATADSPDSDAVSVTIYSSLLDEALNLLEDVISDTHHIFTPSHQHQALLHLATAHTLKATVVLQSKMGSCDVDVSSRDLFTESHDQGEGSRAVDVCVHLSTEQRAALLDGEVERHLTCAVGRWCEWGEGEGERKGDMEKVFYYLRLTAELCSLTRQFELAFKSLGVLVNIYQQSATPSLTASYQTALAAHCELLGVCGGSDISWRTAEDRLLGAVRDEAGGRGRVGRGATDLVTSYLSCRLALATLYLHRGEADRCRAELAGLFHDPILSRHSISTHILTASTRITTAHLLQTHHTPVLPLKQCLTQLLTDKPTPTEGPALYRVTAMELVASAVKTLTSLAEHCGPTAGMRLKGGSSQFERDKDSLTSDPGSWSTLGRLLDGLQLLSSLHLRQGAVREALYYAREGVSLARKMALAAWYREFLALLAQIHLTKGDTEAAHSVLSLSPSPLPSPSGCAELLAARTEAESHLRFHQPTQALAVCREAIASRAEGQTSGVDCAIALAWLHLTAGKAVIGEVALSRPVLMEELWGETEQRTQPHRKKAGSKKTTRVLGWLSLVPQPFQVALTYFCTSLQLCHPVCPPPLLREVYQWLSVVLSPYHCPLAAHCLLQSSHLSLAHLATTMLGKKIHKYSHQDSKHPFYDVLITLQDSSVVCPDSSEPLVLARAVLCPPRSPPPLSFTLSLLSSLPDGCQFTALCLAPSTGCQEDQEHLLLCVVGKNREPLFIKTLVEEQPLLGEFTATLAESEESMRLSEKRVWWNTRRRLDRRMKEVVDGIQSKWLGDYADIFVPPPPYPEGTTGCHLLCVGRLVQHLPWEAMPVLRGQAVTRTPSLSFSIAHQILQRAQRSTTVDPERGYYVLNPRGDLPATEKRFRGWFEEELGWSGVVGHAPSSTQFSEALENHDVFVYCGHGTGREFLSTDNFQLLRCQATTLLMGCGSGRLVVTGACDPVGMALTYLLAGCPSLVAVLWDVTDGDIDKLSKALLEQWLEGGGGEGGTVPLSQALSAARSVCKLEGLNGYAAVMYGDPSTAVTS